jgi:DNA polymerase I
VNPEILVKRALWELSKLDGDQILIPMHDAVLFQHSERINPKIAVEIFESVMTDELGDKVVGKASIENFY